jgi:hypothetical protein
MSAVRAELVRRYLHCYSPSTAADLSAWAGISPHQGGAAWELVADEIEPVEGAGRRSFILRSDSWRFASASQEVETRLLPPHDPLLQLRDRDALVPDRRWHPLVWRSTGNPGVVVIDGDAVGTWRPRKKGGALCLTIESFRELGPSEVRGIEEEAEGMAALRKATLEKIVTKKPR